MRYATNNNACQNSQRRTDADGNDLGFCGARVMKRTTCKTCGEKLCSRCYDQRNGWHTH